MNRFFQRCRRNSFIQYFEALEPIDRATFWVVAGLALALALAIQKLAHGSVVGDFSTPPRPSPPSEQRYA